MTKQVILIAFLGAALIFLVRLFEMKYLTGELPIKLYMLLVGVLFAGIGIWVGLQFRKKATNEANSTSTIPHQQETNSPAPITTQANDILTTRETELLALIAQGMSNKEIAEKVFVSENTVKKHLANIYRKLDVSRRTQAVSKAREMGILSS